MKTMMKTLTALTLLGLLYAAQHPQAIKNLQREKEIYDSVKTYCCGANIEEQKAINEQNKEFKKHGNR